MKSNSLGVVTDVVAVAIAFACTFLIGLTMSCVQEGIQCRLGVEMSQLEALMLLASATFIIALVPAIVSAITVEKMGPMLRSVWANALWTGVLVSLPFIALGFLGLGEGFQERVWLLASVSAAGLACGLTHAMRRSGRIR